MNEKTDWTDALIERLRELWADGHSTATIGRMMGISKNAIVGKAHRLDLDGRPSPIKLGVVRKEYVRKTPKPDHSVPAPRPVRAVKPVFAAPVPKPPTPLPYRRVSQCSYVTNIGRFGVGITYCDDPTVRGPYCEDHANLCLVRVRQRGEMADAAD